MSKPSIGQCWDFAEMLLRQTTHLWLKLRGRQLRASLWCNMFSEYFMIPLQLGDFSKVRMAHGKKHRRDNIHYRTTKDCEIADAKTHKFQSFYPEKIVGNVQTPGHAILSLWPTVGVWKVYRINSLTILQSDKKERPKNCWEKTERTGGLASAWIGIFFENKLKFWSKANPLPSMVLVYLPTCSKRIYQM